MAKRDYYEVLGLTRAANDEEIKASFRKLAMQWHPDKNPGDQDCEHRFKEINEAYDVLKDGERRAAYDRFGHAAFEQGGGAGFGTDFTSAFHDIFDDLFGMGGRRGGRAAPAASAAPTFATISKSRWKKPLPARPRRCGCPRASPAKPAPAPAPSPARSPRPAATAAARAASGTRKASSRWSAPVRPARAAAPLIEQPCKACSGAGRMTRERMLEVQIPAGVEDGTRIRLAGEGEAGMRGGTRGRSLYFSVAHSAPDLPARGRRSLLPRADFDDDRLARRRVRSADHRRRPHAG